MSAAAARLFVEVCQAAVARKGAAVVALSGGSLPARLAGVAGAKSREFFEIGDAAERAVPSVKMS